MRLSPPYETDMQVIKTFTYLVWDPNSQSHNIPAESYPESVQSTTTSTIYLQF